MNIYKGYAHHIICLQSPADDVYGIRGNLDIHFLVAQVLQDGGKQFAFIFFNGNDHFLNLIGFNDVGEFSEITVCFHVFRHFESAVTIGIEKPGDAETVLFFRITESIVELGSFGAGAEEEGVEVHFFLCELFTGNAEENKPGNDGNGGNGEGQAVKFEVIIAVVAVRIFKDEKEQQEHATDNAHNKCLEEFCEFCFLVNGMIGTCKEMQGNPACSIQQQADIETRRYAEMVTVNDGA